MSSKVTRSTYESLIQEDLVEVAKLPDTLERQHIEHVLRDSVRCYYGDEAGNQEEAFHLLDLVDAEFRSDPKSTQCFDLRIVERVRKCVHDWKMIERAKLGTAAIAFLLIAAGVQAQPLTVDKAVPAWPSHRDAASLSSDVLLLTTIGLASVDAWRSEDRGRAFLEQGLSAGMALGGAGLVKLLVHRDRPCAPACGREQPDASFLSGHTGLAFSSSCSLGARFSLATGTGYLRIASAKHWLTDVLAGAALGCGADHLAGRLVRKGGA